MIQNNSKICYIPLNDENLNETISNHGLFQGKQLKIHKEKDFQTALSKASYKARRLIRAFWKS